MIIRDDIKKIVDKYGFSDWKWDYEDVVDGMFADIKSAIEMSVQDKVDKRQKEMFEEYDEKSTFENINVSLNGVPQKISAEGVLSKDDSIVENTVKVYSDDIMTSKLNFHTTGIWRAFWSDRSKFESEMNMMAIDISMRDIPEVDFSVSSGNYRFRVT